jgi:hypothetical protein
MDYLFDQDENLIIGNQYHKPSSEKTSTTRQKLTPISVIEKIGAIKTAVKGKFNDVITLTS